MTSRKGFSRKALQEQLRSDPEFAKHYKEAVSEGIGEALRDARKAADLSQKDVAERMGVTEARVTQLEKTSGNSITLRSLRRYATAVGCQLDVRLVSLSDSNVVSRLFVVDDYSEEPIQIEKSDPVVKEAVAKAILEYHPVQHHRMEETASLIAKRYFTKGGSTQIQIVKMRKADQEAWVPTPAERKYVLAGV